MSLKLSKILNEVKKQQISESQVNEFKEFVANFNKFNENIYGNSKRMDELRENLRYISENVKPVLMYESDDWFDNVVVNKHVKNIQESYRIFEKTSIEMERLQKRMERVYEDIGYQLDRYFPIKSLNELDDVVNEGNAFGAAVTKAKKDGDKTFKVDGKTYKVKK